MPYIAQKEREMFEPHLQEIFKHLKTNQDYKLFIATLALNYCGLGVNLLVNFEKFEILNGLKKCLGRIRTVGQYNYIITRCMHEFIIVRSLNYTNLNAILGIVEECTVILLGNLSEEFEESNMEDDSTVESALGFLKAAQMEFYRMVAVPYENSKIKLNGHVSVLDDKLYED